MKLRNLILRISGMVLVVIIVTMTILVIAYKESKKYDFTYVIGNDYGKSKNCYIDNNDNRICEVKGEIVKVEYYYEEIADE